MSKYAKKSHAIYSLIHTSKIIRLNYERCLFQAIVIRPRSIYWLACYRFVSISISNRPFSKKKIMQVIIKYLLII